MIVIDKQWHIKATAQDLKMIKDLARHFGMSQTRTVLTMIREVHAVMKEKAGAAK